MQARSCRCQGDQCATVIFVGNNTDPVACWDALCARKAHREHAAAANLVPLYEAIEYLPPNQMKAVAKAYGGNAWICSAAVFRNKWSGLTSALTTAISKNKANPRPSQ